MGAAVWLFSEKINNLDGLSLQTDNSMIRQRECFIGTFSAEAMTMDKCLFPTPGSEPAMLQTSKSAMLGMRRIDSDVCLVNPIWELTLDRNQLKGTGPFAISLSQDQNHRECLSIAGIKDETGAKCNSNAATLKLRTMLADQYWLDTGCFEL